MGDALPTNVVEVSDVSDAAASASRAGSGASQPCLVKTRRSDAGTHTGLEINHTPTLPPNAPKHHVTIADRATRMRRIDAPSRGRPGGRIAAKEGD